MRYADMVAGVRLRRPGPSRHCCTIVYAGVRELAAVWDDDPEPVLLFKSVVARWPQMHDCADNWTPPEDPA